MSPRKKANESEQAAELEGGTATTNAATAVSPRAGSFDILELNDLERGITPEDSEDVKWNYLSRRTPYTQDPYRRSQRHRSPRKMEISFVPLTLRESAY